MKPWKYFFLGDPKDPLAKDSHKRIALIAFLAWVGLGADGLSSANYGPESAYLALGQYHHLALYLALATAVTIFIISSGYNQVIRLFPNGGGGYKVATHLLGPYAGLVSGAALIIDYTLTITTSVASGADALFSLLPSAFIKYKLIVALIILFLLLYSNLRGTKESIKILLPIFLAFFITHIIIITVGIFYHEHGLTTVVQKAVIDTKTSLRDIGAFALIALFMRAYSVGAGTYTGLEAVSNNVNILKEPRAKTGVWTMFYMALSLSVVAGGIIFLYLLWNPVPVAGMTLNAVVFRSILQSFFNVHVSYILLVVFMLTEAGILFVAANTGFLGGPAVLANMALDSWVPKQFSILSSRLVKQNGLIFFGVLAGCFLILTDGDVSFLVILYSLNVFITFSLTLLGLSIYWIKNRSEKHWIRQLFLSMIACLICIFVLISALITKFDHGGWITVAVTSFSIWVCLVIKRHYKKVDALKDKIDTALYIPLDEKEFTPTQLDTKKQTAVLLVSELGAAMHTFLWVQRLFPKIFFNFVFISHGIVETGNFGSEREIKILKAKTEKTLKYLVAYAQQQGLAAEYFALYSTDTIDSIVTESEEIIKKYPNCIYFASRYIYPNENWFLRLLHSNFIHALEQKLQLLGIKILVMPLKLF